MSIHVPLAVIVILLFTRYYEYMNIFNKAYEHPNKIGVILVKKKEWILNRHLGMSVPVIIFFSKFTRAKSSLRF